MNHPLTMDDLWTGIFLVPHSIITLAHPMKAIQAHAACLDLRHLSGDPWPQVDPWPVIIPLGRATKLDTDIKTSPVDNGVNRWTSKAGIVLFRVLPAHNKSWWSVSIVSQVVDRLLLNKMNSLRVQYFVQESTDKTLLNEQGPSCEILKHQQESCELHYNFHLSLFPHFNNVNLPILKCNLFCAIFPLKISFMYINNI